MIPDPSLAPFAGASVLVSARRPTAVQLANQHTQLRQVQRSSAKWGAQSHYPDPDPKNEAERAANRQAADDYQRQEEEGADFLDWEKELGWP
ncbi:hypothetical protein AB0F36_37670 [Streptomyces sp. NPDC029080]|uniref:hypothetical protein n=1 Tax=Streptomyces sp. NPDC029080 TaxID=3155017 RepID=UPI0033CB94C8